MLSRFQNGGIFFAFGPLWWRIIGPNGVLCLLIKKVSFLERVPFSQRLPTYPGWHLHVKELTSSVQLPCWHGFGEQSSISKVKHWKKTFQERNLWCPTVCDIALVFWLDYSDSFTLQINMTRTWNEYWIYAEQNFKLTHPKQLTCFTDFTSIASITLAPEAIHNVNAIAMETWRRGALITVCSAQ